MPRRSRQPCNHELLLSTTSSHGREVGYKSFSAEDIHTAATGVRTQINTGLCKLIDSFPAPLVLPGDDLSTRSGRLPQSLRSWERTQSRVTQKRNVIYVAAPSEVSSEVKFMEEWLKPEVPAKTVPSVPPSLSEIIAYLQAFYFGLTVGELPTKLKFHSWSDEPTNEKSGKTATVKYVGLGTEDLITRIRVRDLNIPDETSEYSPSSAYRFQLQQNDILDHAISILPSDACALLLLVNHDLYEDASDDFCCGRAYGGSRVALVSSAQYNPCLDHRHGIKDESDGLNHAWPASHCSLFIDQMCGNGNTKKQDARSTSRKRKRATKQDRKEDITSSRSLATRTKVPSVGSRTGLTSSDPICIGSSPDSPASSERQDQIFAPTPLDEAVAAHRSLPLQTPSFLSSMYALRMARTASHEIGHIFNLAHCVYLACGMQGTCTVAEDTRQPPYLCFVCERKIANMIVKHQISAREQGSRVRSPNPLAKTNDGARNEKSLEEDIQKWIKQRHEAMIAFCEGVGESDTSKREAFKPLAVWSRSILKIEQRETEVPH